ncbi:hypothetical protein MTO96_051362 [Rhipicephalus appendiculatus]
MRFGNVVGITACVVYFFLSVEQRKLRKFRVTDWGKFRKIMEEYVEDEEKPDLERWTEQIGRDIEAAKKGS